MALEEEKEGRRQQSRGRCMFVLDCNKPVQCRSRDVHTFYINERENESFTKEFRTHISVTARITVAYI